LVLALVGCKINTKKRKFLCESAAGKRADGAEKIPEPISEF
jgi:hypothetical protein